MKCKRHIKQTLKVILPTIVIFGVFFTVSAFVNINSIYNLYFNRIVENTPVEPFIAASWGCNYKQVQNILGPGDQGHRKWHTVNGLTYKGAYIWNNRSFMIYRFRDNRLDYVLCWFLVANAKSQNLPEWRDKCVRQILARMNNPRHVIISDNAWEFTARFLDDKTSILLSCTVKPYATNTWIDSAVGAGGIQISVDGADIEQNPELIETFEKYYAQITTIPDVIEAIKNETD